MAIERKECEHAISVLQTTKKALMEKDSLLLNDLSNNMIHSSCSYQDAGSITAAVLIYALSKLMARGDYRKIKNWDLFVKKLNSILDLAILALGEYNSEAYAQHMLRARKALESVSHSLKPYIEEVLRKASINKGGKLYEHGLSAEQTAKLLGITQWELSEYTGQKGGSEINLNRTMSEKRRAQMAFDFFK